MEAALYQDISNALSGRKNKVVLQMENYSPIQKIVWSSFDYMAGPELCFVWDTEFTKESTTDNEIDTPPSTNLGKLNLDNAGLDTNNETTTVDGCMSSSDSSFSKNTGGSSTTRDQFEEIDPYNSDLLQLSQKYDDFEINSNWSNLAQHSGASTSQNQSSILIFDQSDSNVSRIFNDEETPKSLPNKETFVLAKLSNNHDFYGSNAALINNDMVTSCVDSGIAGTISMDSNLSSLLGPTEPRGEVMYKANNQFCNIRLGRKQEYVFNGLQEAQEVIEFDHNTYSDITGAEEMPKIAPRNTQSALLMHSQVESSFYSNYSSNTEAPKETAAVSILHKEAEMFAAELTSADSMGNSLSDEAFITKQVLAEQIGSVQLTSNPVLHKFCIVPSRHISFAAYIFSTRHGEEAQSAAPTLSAFSIIIPMEKSEWYLQRQHLFQEIITDVIARFKAAHLVEETEDLICRCTKEFSTMLTLFGALERWPLVKPELQKLRIHLSHLWELRKEKNDQAEFIARCITACLICQGRCTVVGSNSKEVFRLLMTLNAFLEPKERMISLKPHKLPFSPYLRLQSIKRSDVYQFFEQAANAYWPCSLLDIDRKSVIFTGLYQKHRAQKKMAQYFQISQIFREAMEAGLAVPSPILKALDQQLLNVPKENFLETHVVRADPSVIDFMEQICLLPLNRAARLSFVDHFHLRMDNNAKALIIYVRDFSVPSPNDKRSAISSKWHLATVRRNLNLQHDSTYGITMARADNLLPEFAEFITQQTTSTGLHY